MPGNCTICHGRGRTSYGSLSGDMETCGRCQGTGFEPVALWRTTGNQAAERKRALSRVQARAVVTKEWHRHDDGGAAVHVGVDGRRHPSLYLHGPWPESLLLNVGVYVHPRRTLCTATVITMSLAHRVPSTFLNRLRWRTFLSNVQPLEVYLHDFEGDTFMVCAQFERVPAEEL